MQNQKHKGFTLIELLLVITIISILAGVILPNFMGKGEEARSAAALAAIKGTFSIALDMYEQDYGKYPTTLNLLEGKYIRDFSPLDPWDNEYQYTPGSDSSTMYEIISAGPDGSFGTEDDIPPKK